VKGTELGKCREKSEKTSGKTMKCGEEARNRPEKMHRQLGGSMDADHFCDA